jgi:hypothetical protein
MPSVPQSWQQSDIFMCIKKEACWKVVASVPDLITMVDHETSSPINSERVDYGQRVTIFGIGCPPHYRTERALKVVEPRAFGFDFVYMPIEKL